MYSLYFKIIPADKELARGEQRAYNSRATIESTLLVLGLLMNLLLNEIHEI